MPINTRHKRAEALKEIWRKSRDTVAGEEAIKAAGEEYLPRLSDQELTDYDAYKTRATFFAATGRTVDGLSGAIRRKPEKVEWPTGDEDRLKNIGRSGESLEQLIGVSIREVLTPGRLGLLVDAPPPGPGDFPPYVTIYFAENIINWREEMVDGTRKVTLVVLEEEVEVIDPKDPYKHTTILQWRCLHLGTTPAYGEGRKALVFAPGFSERDVAQPFYYQEVWRKAERSADSKDTFVMTERTTPRMTGGRLFYEIPFAFVNPADNSPDPSEPPLLDLINVNLSHYRTSADLEHGRHFTALPTPWFAGFKFAGTIKIGSGVAYSTEDSQAQAGMLEFTGAGLGHLHDAIEEKERQMAVLGSRLIEGQKAAAEAAATVKMRTAGEQSALTLISKTLSGAWTKALRWLWSWSQTTDANADQISVELNRDFNILGLDAQMLEKMMAAVQAGLMSWETWFANLQRGEIIKEGVTAEDEWAAIEEGLPAPLGLTLPPALPPGQADPNAAPPPNNNPPPPSTPPAAGN